MTKPPASASDARDDLLYATLLGIGDGVIATDGEARVTLMNPVAERLTGWRLDEARGRPIDAVFPLLHEETRTPVASPVRRVLEEGIVVGLANHSVLVARDGTERPIADSGAPIRDAAGAVAGVVIVFRDQTRERSAERELRAAHERLRALLAAIPDIVMEVDARKVYTWANEAGLRFFGPDVLGHEAAAYFEGEQDTYEQVAPLFGGDEQTFYVESWQRRQDGARRLLGWWCRVLRDGSGAVIGALSSARDLTEERSSADLLERFVKESPIYAFIKEVQPGQSRVIVASENYRDMVGVPGSQLAGRTMGELFPPEFAAKITADDWAVVDRGEVLDLDEELGGRQYRTLKFPIVQSGRTLLAGYTIDVTDQRRAEVERRDLQASLAESGRLASMGLLAAGVAHEINNPLTYVLGNLQSVLEDLLAVEDLPGRDELLGRLRETVAGAGRIQEIVRGLSAYSRVDRAEREPVDVRRCLEHALSMAKNELRFRARVVLDLAPIPEVLATDGKVCQIVLNLLLNAAHAIEEGQAERNEVRVRTWIDGHRVGIEVSDTGRGIPEADLGRIFEPIFTTKPAGQGTGLGLPICRNLVTSLGGEIGCASPPGGPTRFWVTLPAADAPSPAARRPVTPAPGPSPRRGRILVVDDEAGVRRILVRMLGSDHEVVAEESGRAARERLAEDRGFDVVLCDVMMPEVSGVELHQWLAGVDPGLAGRVVFISGGVFSLAAQEYLSRVPNPRVDKPFDPAALRDVVTRLVRKARSGSSG